MVTAFVTLALATGVGIAAAALISKTETSGYPSAGMFGITPVHDGDMVAMSGTVMILPSGATQFCPWYGKALTVVSGAVDTSCDEPIPLYGLRANELTDPQASKSGVIVGAAYIEGLWHDHAVEVRNQGPPRETSPGTAADSRPPCPPPAEGWLETGPGWQPPRPLVDFVNGHPDDFSGLDVAYPDWEAGDDTPASVQPRTEVVVIGVVGDQRAARQRISAIYSGNLCLTTALYSAADLHKASRMIRPHVGQWGINSAAIGWWQPGMEVVDLDVLVVNEHVWDLIKEAGPEMVNVEPVVRKISAD